MTWRLVITFMCNCRWIGVVLTVEMYVHVGVPARLGMLTGWMGRRSKQHWKQVQVALLLPSLVWTSSRRLPPQHYPGHCPQKASTAAAAKKPAAAAHSEEEQEEKEEDAIDPPADGEEAEEESN